MYFRFIRTIQSFGNLVDDELVFVVLNRSAVSPQIAWGIWSLISLCLGLESALNSLVTCADS
jgi:hypothetical protein